MPDNLPPLPKDLQIYRAAKQFSVAAGVIEKHTGIENSLMFAVQPFVTCASFSLELYLKCILEIRSQPESKEHSLSALFKLLPSSDQEALLFFLRGAYADLSLPIGFLENGLQSMANAFVQWRYLHEKSSASIDLQFLRRMAWACQEHIKSLRPEWWPDPSMH